MLDKCLAKMNVKPTPSKRKEAMLLCLILLLFSMIAEHFAEHHPYFEIDATFAFNAFYAIIAGFCFVIFSVLMGIILTSHGTDDD